MHDIVGQAWARVYAALVACTWPINDCHQNVTEQGTISGPFRVLSRTTLPGLCACVFLCVCHTLVGIYMLVQHTMQSAGYVHSLSPFLLLPCASLLDWCNHWRGSPTNDSIQEMRQMIALSNTFDIYMHAHKTVMWHQYSHYGAHDRGDGWCLLTFQAAAGY